MIELKIEGLGKVERLLAQYPEKAKRACAVALTLTGKEVKKAEQAAMRSVFSNPVAYTLNSLQLDPATYEKLKAVVWFKSPDRMGAHYLVPQVEGGPRRLKGFELAIGLGELIPGQGARMTAAGNISIGQIRQFLSVLGRAERAAGYTANASTRSRTKNRKQRDYIILPRKHGKLYPGVYQRVSTGQAVHPKVRRAISDKSKAYQRGKRTAAIRARGLKPILIKGKQGGSVQPRLDFYKIAREVQRKFFAVTFNRIFRQYMKS